MIGLAAALGRADTSAAYRMAYRYDVAGRLAESRDELGVTSYTYPDDRSFTRRLPGGLITRVQLDADRRPASVEHSGPFRVINSAGGSPVTSAYLREGVA